MITIGSEVSDLGKFEQVMQTTLETVEKSKTLIFEIAENARQDMARLKKELYMVQRDTAEAIREVDELRVRITLARQRYAEIAKDIARYTPEDQQSAHEAVVAIQSDLKQKQEREKQLRKRRDDLEMSLRSLNVTIEKGEELVSYVSAALNLLKGSLYEISHQVEGMQQRQQIGVKVIMAQEDERKRVAREIHDGPAQSMANVVLRAEFCERLIDTDLAKAKQELHELKDVVRNCLADVRRIIFDLRPMTLDDLGLIPTIRRYVGDFKEKNGIDTTLQILGKERRLEPTVEVALFRATQEALNNISKHARARSVMVKVEMLSRQVTIVVRDDGRGFDLEKVLADKTRNSLGLVSMRERIELVLGQFTVQSAPGKGTLINIVVPTDERLSEK
ncbi:MAG: sensor histidine kinase [Bacillota bacterium]